QMPEAAEEASVKGTAKDSLPPTYMATILFKSTHPWSPVAEFADSTWTAHIAAVAGIMNGDPSLEVTIYGSVGYDSSLQNLLYRPWGAGPTMDVRAEKVRAELKKFIAVGRIHIARGTEGMGADDRKVEFIFSRK